MTPEQRREAFARFAAASPNPRGELQFGTPFELLVAVILSAQATDKSVNAATAKLFPVANTPQQILDLGEEGLKSYIRTINFYPTKARNIIAASRLLVDRFGGEVPDSREALEGLPGVGRKTASVVLNIAFGQPEIAVDTHIFRLSNRSGIASGRDPLEVEQGLVRLVPPEFHHDAHHWLILHGRYVCTARKPACSACLIGDLCDFNAAEPG